MSSSVSRRLLVDVTQYVTWPARSGVQRVLQYLAEEWPGRTIEARFGFIEDEHYVTGPIAELGAVIASTFRASDSSEGSSVTESVRQALRAEANATISTREVEKSFDAYLLPEPTLRRDNLAVATRLLASERTPPFFVYYDALPLTHPEFFPRDVEREAPLVRYNSAVARSDNVAFISGTTRKVFEGRIARRRLERAIVTRLGADGLARVDSARPDIPIFTIVGTVEPRKRHAAALEAFERLWASGQECRLVVIGPPGFDMGLVERLRTHAQSSRVTWIETADDYEIAVTLAKSAALIFISQAEGYGLPPLEALAIGCPVVVSAELPALEGLSDAGQIRLSTVDTASIASAVQTLADPASNATYRRAIEHLNLPTWNAFAISLEEWIASVLSTEGDGNDID